MLLTCVSAAIEKPNCVGNSTEALGSSASCSAKNAINGMH